MDRLHFLTRIFFVICLISSLKAKKFDKCEFIKALINDFHVEQSLAQTWTCLGEEISGLDSNLKVAGTKNLTFNGIFQVSSEYWCEEKANKTGKGCNINCGKLLDDDLKDDIACVQTIFKQHSGFSAWPVYETSCKDVDYREFFKKCPEIVVFDDKKSPETKIYEKCELVKELYEQHGVPMEMLGTITCIAKEESQFNTAAIGSMNNDKSLDHGIFQISDKFWCLNDEKDDKKAGKNCNLPCSSLRDANITDDVKCMKQIYDKTAKFSESGYDAWLVYTKNDSLCRDPDTNFAMIEECLDKKSLISEKSLEKCELAHKLKSLNVPLQDIPTFVCLAHHESRLLTSKISPNGQHGLFGITEGKWCSSNDVSSVGCEVTCDQMRDKDISDDVQCARKIRALLGFNGWKSFKGNCDGEKAKKFTESCGLRTTEVLIGAESRQEVTNYPFYLLHFSDPENSIRATLEIGKENLRDGKGIKIIPIVSTKSPHKMNGLSVVIEDGGK